MLTIDRSLVVAGHFAQLSAALAAVEAEHGDRWPLLRTGEREPIRPSLRALVYGRDGHRCAYCTASWSLQIDHIVPWSAYGTDRSDNLRTLCADCNSDRSNYLEAYLPRVLPVTGVCHPCMRESYVNGGHEDYYDPADAAVRRAAWCGWCRSVSWVTDSRWFA